MTTTTKPTKTAAVLKREAQKELRALTRQVTKCEEQADALKDERRVVAQKFYDLGVPVRDMYEACGYSTQYGLNREIETRPRRAS